MGILSKIFGTKYTRDINKMMPLVDEINAIYETLRDVGEEELLARTDRFREDFRADREDFLRKSLPSYLGEEEAEAHVDEYLAAPVPLWEDMLERHLRREMAPEDRRLKAEQFAKDPWPK